MFTDKTGQKHDRITVKPDHLATLSIRGTLDWVSVLGLKITLRHLVNEIIHR